VPSGWSGRGPSQSGLAFTFEPTGGRRSGNLPNSTDKPSGGRLDFDASLARRDLLRADGVSVLKHLSEVTKASAQPGHELSFNLLRDKEGDLVRTYE
jgi:hypothetical protein